MLKRLSAIGCALALSACGTIPVYSDEERATFDGGGAMILFDVTRDGVGCGYSYLDVENVKTRETSRLYAQHRGGVDAVAPGEYRIDNLTCGIGDTTYYNKSASLWFLPFTAKAGEVLYLGTLNSRPIQVESQRDPGQAAALAVLTLGLTLLLPNELRNFPVFEFNDHTEGLREHLRPEIGDLVDVMVKRSPERFLSETAFRDAIIDAHKRGPNGEVPKLEDVSARLDAAMPTVLAQSLIEYARAHPAKPDADGSKVDPSIPPPMIVRPPAPPPTAPPVAGE